MQTSMPPTLLAPHPRRALSPGPPAGDRADAPSLILRPTSTPMELEGLPSPRRVPSPWQPQPSEPQKQAPPPAEALAALRLAIGKAGADRSFEDLRRAIMSAQQEGKNAQRPLQLAIGGPLARWLAHGPASAPPPRWHLLVLVPEQQGAWDGPAAKQILQAIHKRLLKRSFTVLEVGPHSLTLADVDKQPVVDLRLCPEHDLSVPGALLCEQLVYTLKDKAWHAPMGMDVQAAWHYAALGLYRLPKLTLADAHAMPPTFEQAMEALLSSWRYQRAGYSPAQPLDFADVAPLQAVLDEIVESNVGKAPSPATVRLVHDMLLPMLCAPDSDVGRQQLGLTAVALCQLGQFLGCLPGEPGEHPLYAAVLNVLRSACPQQDGPMAAALAIVEALSGPWENTAVLRLFLTHCRGPHVQAQCATVQGAAGPMLRIALPALRTHLFVPDVDPKRLGALSGEPTLEAIAAAVVDEASPLGDSLAFLLSCPALGTLVDATALACQGQRQAWAEALQEVVAASDGPRTATCQARLLAAIALLCPQRVSALPAAVCAALPLDVLKAAMLAASASTGDRDAEPLVHRSLPLAALLERHLDAGRAPQTLETLSTEQQVDLMGALARTGNPSLALTALEQCPQVMDHLPGALHLRLLEAALAQEHILGTRLIEAIAASPEHSVRLLAHKQLFAAACKNFDHLEPLGHVLATSNHCPTPAWKAWLQAVSQASRTGPLVAFIDRADPAHEGYRTALQKLTDLLHNNAKAQGAPTAERGWRLLLEKACKSGDEGVDEALALLTLEDTQRRFGHKVPKFTDEEASDLAYRVLLNMQDQASVSLALWRLRHLGNSTMFMEGFVFCLQSASAEMIRVAWGKTWHAYLGAMLAEVQPFIADLDTTAGNTLIQLAAHGFVSEDILLSDACEVAALTVHVLLQHNRPELAFALLQHASTEPESLHPLLHHLEHAPGLDLLDNHWLSIVKSMAQKVSPFMEEPATSATFVPLHQVSLWAQWTERLTEARLHADTLGALPEAPAIANIRDCLGLLRVRHVFVPLRSDEPLLKELSVRVQTQSYYEAALDYLKQLEHLHQQSPATIPGPASDLPPAPLWHAVLRGRALHADDAILPRQILTDVADVSWQGSPAVIAPQTPFAGVLFAMEIIDVLLIDKQYDHAGRRALIQSVACRDLHQPGVAQRLETLHQRAIAAGHDANDAPILMAVEHLVTEGGHASSMSPAQRAQHERAAGYVAHALCILRYEMPRVVRAQALVRLIDSLGSVAPGVWFTLKFILTDEDSLLTALPEEGTRCLARFKQCNRGHLQEPTPADLDPEIGKAIVEAHLTIALSRLAAPHLSITGLSAAINHFLDMHVTFNQSQRIFIYEGFQRVLSLVFRDERINSGLLEALLVRHLDPRYVSPHPLFVEYLFETLTAAAPINACHLGIYLAICQRAGTAGDNGRLRDLGTKRMLRRSNKQMVQAATELSRMVGRCKVQVIQQPERLQQITLEALSAYNELWPHTWPSPICEPAQRSLA